MRALVIFATTSLLIAFFQPAFAQKPLLLKSLTAKYQVKFRNQLGADIDKPMQDLSTNRFLLDMEQNLDWANGFSANFSGRVLVEAAYGANPDKFTDLQAREDSSNIELREAFAQYRKGPLMLRLGSQQIVWGESFGFFFSDIVNAKDLRDGFFLGLFELADYRLPSPFANLQWRGSDWTLQLIHGFTAPKNRTARWGGPYSPVSYSDLGGSEDSVSINSNAKLDGQIGDTGFRFSKNVLRTDLSLFAFSYIDRMPFYKVQSFTPSPFALVLQEYQARAESVGFNLSYDFSGYLTRFDFVRTSNRRINTFVNSSLVDEPISENIAVLGVDLPNLEGWLSSLQFSNSSLEGMKGQPVGRDSSQFGIGLRFSRDISSLQNVEIMGHYFPGDANSFFTSRWIFARSSTLEFLLGVEALIKLDGPEAERVHDASRVLLGIKGIFNG